MLTVLYERARNARVPSAAAVDTPTRSEECRRVVVIARDKHATLVCRPACGWRRTERFSQHAIGGREVVRRRAPRAVGRCVNGSAESSPRGDQCLERLVDLAVDDDLRTAVGHLQRRPVARPIQTFPHVSPLQGGFGGCYDLDSTAGRGLLITTPMRQIGRDNQRHQRRAA